VSFAAYDRDPIRQLIVSASEPPKVSLLVGAGASMEAGLPSWNALIDRLLIRGAEKEALLPSDDEKAQRLWLNDASRDGPFGAAAMVDALAGDERDGWVVEALYGDGGAASFFPGPIARQVAELQLAFGERSRLMTLNYDDLGVISSARRAPDLAPTGRETRTALST
jgi:hypothetical protein